MVSTTTADPVSQIDSVLRRAIVAACGDEHADTDPLIRPSQRPELGDFQANVAMALGKATGRPPREVAEAIVDAANEPLAAIAEPLEIAGPGFINIRLKATALAEMLAALAADDGLGVPDQSSPRSIVIDLCAVNVAKQMHVGHLRSTIIGDALGRVFERLGRKVYRENHLGDWGLPIAMVLSQLRAEGRDLDALELTDLDEAYRAAQMAGRQDQRGLDAAHRLHAGPHRIAELEDQNEGAREVVERAKQALVALQQGDAELERDWHKLIDVTMTALFEAVAIMGVKLGPEHNRGESFYRDRLQGVIDAYLESGVAEEDDGALIVRFDDRDRPILIRKSDGGFLYATTDLAACQFRSRELHAERVIYVVDARQRDHFRDVFDAVAKVGWDRDEDGQPVEFRHIGFGSVLGEDRKPLKTRAGRNVTLRSLLDEACERGAAEVRRRSEDPKAPTHGLPDAELAEIGRIVGMGAIKYADLSNDLVRDYVFDMDRMIAFEGDTGPYLQYAHTRICSIFARANVDESEFATASFVLQEPQERAVALALLRYPGVITDVARELEPHRLCQFLFELANLYNGFYTHCPVLKVDDPAIRLSRLRLSHLVRRVLADGLDLLGIVAPERM